MYLKRLLAGGVLAAALVLVAPVAQAAVGVTEIAGKDGDGPVTVYYPTRANAQPLKRGPFTLALALDAAPARGNGRLVVLSHGSGGSPWVHSDLARAIAGQRAAETR